MYLHPVRFLWRQLNGPQITAIMTALFRWIRDMFNPTIHYLATFSIATATDDHLTLIGGLQRVIRPMISIARAHAFIFTAEPETGKSYGVSASPGPLQVGGVFSDPAYAIRQNILCPAEYFRAILLACKEQTAEPFSIVFIDKVLGELWNKYHPGETPHYTFIWMDGTDGPLEDVRITLGSIEDWGGEDIAVVWQAVLEGIINNVWKPTRVCRIEFTQ